MAILDFDNVVVTVDGKTANSMVNTAPVFAVDATWAGIADKPSVFPPAAHNHDGLYLPIHGTADLSGAVVPIQLTNGTDLNDLKPDNMIWYYAPSSATIVNKPAGVQGFSLYVYRVASAKMQVCSTTANASYARVYTSGEWSTWRLMPFYFSNAGHHNSVYRGNNLGAEITSEQWDVISSGKFDNLFIGDYWVINNINWRIAAFDYWFATGDTTCNTHHAVIVPDTPIVIATMNSTDTTEGAYAGSDFYTGNNGNTGKAEATSIVESAFGASHILSYRDSLANAVTDGYESAGSYVNCGVELMNESMLFGHEFNRNIKHGTNKPFSTTISKTQLPLFFYDPQRIRSATNYWLRDVASETEFCRATRYGSASANSANAASHGIRPVFGICA